jgi:hypothetical protein
VETAIKRTNQIIVTALCNRAQISSQLAPVIRMMLSSTNAIALDLGIPISANRYRRSRGWPSILAIAFRRAGGKNRSIEIRAGIRTAPISLQLPGLFFVLPEIFEVS